MPRFSTLPGPALGPVGDEALVATAAWASFAAARRVGSWLHTAPASTDRGEMNPEGQRVRDGLVEEAKR